MSPEAHDPLAPGKGGGIVEFATRRRVTVAMLTLTLVLMLVLAPSPPSGPTRAAVLVAGLPLPGTNRTRPRPHGIVYGSCLRPNIRPTCLFGTLHRLCMLSPARLAAGPA